MKILGQDSNGRIVIDGEGERVDIHSLIPADSPVFITNFTFIEKEGTKSYDELLRCADVKS